MSRPEASDPTQAHDAVTQERIEHVADLMRTCRFFRGRTAKELAKEWGLTQQRVREITAAASKVVYAEVMGDREAVGEKIGAALGVAIEGAIQDRDWRALSGLAKVYADATGVSAPIKSEVVVSDVAELSAQLTELARRMVGKPAGEGASEGAESIDSGASDSAEVGVAELLGAPKSG